MRRSLRVVLAAALATAALLAERPKPAYDPDSPEGRLLDLIDLQASGPKRIALLEQFGRQHASHPAAAWAFEQLLRYYSETGQHDLLLAAGERLLDHDANDFDVAQLCLKSAEAKKDPVLVRIWSDFTVRVAERILESPAAPASQKEQAAQFTSRGDYVLYKQALDTADLKTRIQLLADLLRHSPSTAYKPQIQQLCLRAYRALGDSKNARLTAQQILQRDPDDPDALLATAESLFDQLSEAAIPAANRVLDALRHRPKPSEMSEPDWAKQKAVYAGTAHWIAGMTHLNQNRFVEADRSLRAAVALLKGHDQSLAALFFHLGWANFKLENFPDAARFYQQCQVLPGKYQQQAATNLKALRAERGVKD